jgi:hypothetical protein
MKGRMPLRLSALRLAPHPTAIPAHAGIHAF